MLRIIIALRLASQLELVVDAQDHTEIVATGRVVDADGTPVSKATVSVIGKQPFFCFVPHRSPGRINGKCDSNGFFRIAWKRSDHRFLESPNVVLVAHDGVDAMVAVDVPLQKLIAGVTISLKLNRAASGSIRVEQSDGRLLPDARVSAAKFASVSLPYQPDDQSLVKAVDVDGSVTFPGVSSPSLSHVYIASPSVGHQCVAVTRDDQGRRVVRTQLSDAMTGSVKLPDDEHAETEDDQAINWDGVVITFMTEETADGSYAWSEVSPQSSGRLVTTPLPTGNLKLAAHVPDSLPFTLERNSFYNFKRPDPGQPLVVPFEQATIVTGQLTEAAGDQPLANIFVHLAEPGPPVFSKTDGTFTFRHSQRSIGYLPTDALGRHFIANASFIYPQELPVGHNLQLAPEVMQSASRAVGKVIDQAGNSVSGARVTCNYKVGQFDLETTYYTDQSGEFRFAEVTDGADVILTATTDRQRTPSPMRLVLTDDSRPVLNLHPRFGLRMVGRVVDSRGNPIDSATVQVRYPVVSIEESEGGMDTAPTDAFADEGPIVTDVDGRFISPPTLDWDRKFSLVINAPGKRTMANYWRDAEEAGKHEIDFDWGTLTMLDDPAKRSRIVQVVSDDTQTPIEGARVVFLGCLHGRSTGLTGTDGRSTINRPDGVQVIAVEAKGYRPFIQRVDLSAEDLPTISLVRPGSPIHPRLGASVDQDERKRATMKLLKILQPPSADDTPHRQRLYYKALAFADFDSVLATVIERIGKGNGAAELVISTSATQPWLNENQIESLLPFVDERMRVQMLLNQAAVTSDVEKKQRLLGEAISWSQSFRGDEQLYALYAIANPLLGLGATEPVKEAYREAWKSRENFAAIIQHGERIKMTGISRAFAPLYALVDFDAAMEFIRLTAPSDEIEQLQAQAMIYVAAYDPSAWREIAERRGIKQIPTEGMRAFRDSISFATFDGGAEVLAQIAPGNEKIEPLLDLAESNLLMADGSEPSDTERLALVKQVLEILDQQDTSYARQEGGWQAARSAKLISKWDPELSERFLFAAIWNCDVESTILPMNVTCQLASKLAAQDRVLAKALVSPAFEDWSWLFETYDANVIFRSDPPINAAAAIDPEWAVELAAELFERYFRDTPSRKYETIDSIVHEWTQ